MRNGTKRLLVVIAWGGLGLFLLAVSLRTSTVPVRAGQADGPSSPRETEGTTLGLTDWKTLMLDEFDGTYTTTFSIYREVTSIGSADYEWGRVISDGVDFVDTMWCVQGGEGASLTAGADPYPNGVTTMLTYGPINFVNVVAAELSFQHWISVASGDGLEWGYSTDGESFVFADVSPSTMGDWDITTLSSETSEDLDPLLGERFVYLAFRFHSDNDDQVAEGAFLDDVQLRARYDATLYMPLGFLDLYAGYSDDFSNWGSGWPAWKKKTYNPSGSTAEDHRGGYKDVSGNDLYYVWVRDDGDEVFLTGPERVPSKFVFDVRARWAETTDRWGNEYGVLISKAPIKPKDAHTFYAYTFQIQLLPGKSCPNYAIKKWVRTNWKDDVDRLKGYSKTCDVSQSKGTWNQFRIMRVGSGLKFYLKRASSSTWKYIGQVNDSSLPPDLYIGFFAAHEQSYAYPLEWQYDDVAVHWP